MSEDLVDEIVMKPKKKSKKSVLQNDAVQFTEILSKRGVIYIARIPPFMKPNKMRNIFEEFGEVTRLFLAEEDIEMKKKRKESGGNSSKQFHEGWIEYADKKTARQVAESLNNTSIGGKKSSYYHDDIWNVKYLKGFKYVLKVYLLTLS
jgi:ESF2/ABP1 family protein